MTMTMTTAVQPTILRTVSYQRRKRDVEHIDLSLVADTYRRYPGESLTLFMRVETLVDVSHFSLSLDIPTALEMTDFRAPGNLNSPVPVVEDVGQGIRMTWYVDQVVPKCTQWEFEVYITVRQDAASGDVDNHLECECESHVRTASGDESDISTGLAIAISPKGRYLKYLPSIYREDALMARFLMLFESFWAPIESQIDKGSYYLDPQMTPLPLLPWLASWADLVLDDRWSERKQRRLLQSIVSLYRKRGTRSGLEEMLEIYTGVQPQVLEHRANNLILGPMAQLGPSIALGSGNVPHTFTVTLRLPPITSTEAQPLSQAEIDRYESERRRVIESIIESEKPAHTRYKLEIEQV